MKNNIQLKSGQNNIIDKCRLFVTHHLSKRQLSCIKVVFKCVSGLHVYVYNHLFNKIPLLCIRLFFSRFYMRIGKGSSLRLGVRILNNYFKRSNITIGNNCVINDDCLLDGREYKIKIGNNVDIARQTIIYTLQHDYNDDYHRTKGGDVIIEDYVWIGSRVIILPGVCIGKGAVCASGAVVTKKCRTVYRRGRCSCQANCKKKFQVVVYLIR
jgi:maltose O-acetyltransferase